MTKATKAPTLPATMEVADTRHAAFVAYEQAIKDGYTSDWDNPPEILMNGYTILRLKLAEEAAPQASEAPITLVCTGKTSVKAAVKGAA